MITPELATAVIVALGGASIIPKAIEGVRAWRSGKAREERRSNREGLNQLEDEMAYRRRMQEYASGLRRLLVEWGYPEDKLPAWPTRQTQETTK